MTETTPTETTPTEMSGAAKASYSAVILTALTAAVIAARYNHPISLPIVIAAIGVVLGALVARYTKKDFDGDVVGIITALYVTACILFGLAFLPHRVGNPLWWYALNVFCPSLAGVLSILLVRYLWEHLCRRTIQPRLPA